MKSQAKANPAFGPDGLTDNDHAILRQAIARYPDIHHATLFGSRAMGTFGQGSDIDLALTGPALTQRTLAKLANELEESDLPYQVDLLIRNKKLNPKLQEHIRKHGKPLGWETNNIEDLCEAVIDCPHSTPAWTDAGKLVLRSQNIRNGRLDLSQKSFTDTEHFTARNRRIVPTGGDLVITREAPMGEVCLLPDGLECCLGQRMVLLRPDCNQCDPRYLLYAIQSPHVQNQIGWSEGTGSTVSNLRIPHLKALEIKTPSLPEQRAIASVLGSLDDKIELNRRMNRTLEQMAAATFKAWFVDFDPVRAKASGATTFPGMPQQTFDALPTTFQDSPLGPIPEGWDAGELGDIVGLQNGFAFKSKDWQNAGTPVVKIGSVKPGIVDLSQVSYVSDEIAEQSERYRLLTGDLLIGMTGYVGEAGLVPHCDSAPLLNQRVGRFTLADRGTKHLGFIYCFTRRPEFKPLVESKSHGTAQANVSSKDILSIPLVVPPAMFQDAFNATVRNYLDAILANVYQAQTLADTRDALLPKLLSGEVRVSAEAGVA